MPGGRGSPEDVAKELIKAKEAINSEDGIDNTDKESLFCATVEVVKRSIIPNYGIEWSEDYDK